MIEEDVDFGALMDRRDELASSGRTAVLVGVDGRGVGVLALADAARETSADAVAALHDLGVEVVMLSGDNQATANRIAAQLGIDTVIAEVLPGDKAAKIADCSASARRSPWSAMASMTRRRWPKLISESRSVRAPTLPSKPQIWC